MHDPKSLPTINQAVEVALTEDVFLVVVVFEVVVFLVVVVFEVVTDFVVVARVVGATEEVVVTFGSARQT